MNCTSSRMLYAKGVGVPIGNGLRGSAIGAVGLPPRSQPARAIATMSNTMSNKNDFVVRGYMFTPQDSKLAGHIQASESRFLLFLFKIAFSDFEEKQSNGKSCFTRFAVLE